MSEYITGMDEVFANMDRHLEQQENQVDGAVQNAGIVCQGSTKQRCPVDKGRLRSSYQYTKTGKMQCMIGTNVFYASFIELGHASRSGSFVPAKPHLYPGALDGATALIDDLKNIGA